MEIYIAAPFDWRVKAKRAREVLAKKGFISTATWIDSHLQEEHLSNEDRWKEARQDLLDIHRAGGFVLLNGPSTSGGLHIELGFAIAKGKRIWLVGQPSTIFHYHPSITVVESVDNINLQQRTGDDVI